MSISFLRPAFRWSLVFAALISTAAAQGDGPRRTDDGKFTIEVEVPRTGVVSQDMTGTCWSFGTTSFLESEATRITGKQVDLSEMYLVPYTFLEKARAYVEKKGKNTFGQGGLAHDVVEMTRRYGIVPAESYSGLREGQKMHNHGEMEGLLKSMADQIAKARRASKRWEDAFIEVAQTYMGHLPEKITVDGKEMTPKEYADNYLQLPYDDYVEVMSFATEPFDTAVELKVPDNWMHDGRYWNVASAEMMAALDHALRNGFSVAVDMDVSEDGFKANAGMASLTAELEADGAITDAMRKEAFENGKTTDDHLMHIVGIARDDKGGVWYITKNSWGSKVGPYKGYVMMSRGYVHLKMLSFMVSKKGLPTELVQKFSK